MGIEPYYKKKFRSRKYRLDPTDNYKLDKIRGEDGKESVQKGKLNAALSLVIAVGILVVALLIPGAARSVIIRRHTDALVTAKKTSNIFLGEVNGMLLPDDTIMVVEQSGSYYLFWYKMGAGVYASKRDTSPTLTDFVEINNPQSYRMPINVKKGKTLKYPFEENPIESNRGKIKLLDGLEVLEGYTVEDYPMEEELANRIPKNAKLFSFVKVD